MASLCVGYLSLPGFYDHLGDASVKELLNCGYYAFLDYAACYWVAHLRAGMGPGLDEASVKSLINCLQPFLDAHHRSTAERIEIQQDTRQVFHSLQIQGQWHDFKRFLEAFQATENQVQAFGESAAINDSLDMPDVIARIRRYLEETKSDISNGLAENIRLFYGTELFKCARMSCDFFHLGFPTSKQRDEHMMKHSRPFRCSFSGCLRSTLAFSSQKELEKHTSHAHKSTNEVVHSYPSKRKKYSLQCSDCQEEFFEPQRFSSHTCTMSRKHPKRRITVTQLETEIANNAKTLGIVTPEQRELLSLAGNVDSSQNWRRDFQRISSNIALSEETQRRFQYPAPTFPSIRQGFEPGNIHGLQQPTADLQEFDHGSGPEAQNSSLAPPPFMPPPFYGRFPNGRLHPPPISRKKPGTETPAIPKEGDSVLMSFLAPSNPEIAPFPRNVTIPPSDTFNTLPRLEELDTINDGKISFFNIEYSINKKMLAKLPI